MTNSQNTKRALISSLVSLFLCFTMLLGTTFAWFTDEVISSGNKIQAGTLKIDLLVRDENGAYKSVRDNKDPIFNYDRWEPGYTQVVNVKVENKGTLALQYRMQIIVDGMADAIYNNEPKLSDVIDVYYAADEVLLNTDPDFDAAVANGALKKVGTLTDVILGGTMIQDTLGTADENGVIDNEDYATIVLKMHADADNMYQGLSVGNSFDIKLLAAQLAYEDDSFGNQYDNIQFPSATMLVMNEELLTMKNLDAGCYYMAKETWNEDWKYDFNTNAPAEGTPAYAFYFADFVISFSESHAADEVGLWGYYEYWGAEETFKMDAITANEDIRVIPLADQKLDKIDMGKISYEQLLKEVQNFACGVTEGSLKNGETITVTLRIYETVWDLAANGFVETGAYQDVAVYTYTDTNAPVQGA